MRFDLNPYLFRENKGGGRFIKVTQLLRNGERKGLNGDSQHIDR